MSVAAEKLNGPYDCVVDVGAGRGVFAAACLEAWPGCTVHSFEPARGVANADERQWHWHRVALSDREPNRLDDYADQLRGRALLRVAPRSCRLQVLLGAAEALPLFAGLLLPAANGEVYGELLEEFVDDAGFGRAWRDDTCELWVRS